MRRPWSHPLPHTYILLHSYSLYTLEPHDIWAHPTLRQHA